MPYRYIEDIATADAAFALWGESREELFRAAAEALLNEMVENPAAIGTQETADISLRQEALDLLLMDFLNELIYLKDARQLLLRVDEMSLGDSLGGFTLQAHCSGERIDPTRHHLLADVKAATLYRLKVERVERRWKGTVVLDI
ncbi:archease [Geomobilimonas luticola]|uniref:Archease n=1 Tax=Geomobilimonas luticola TaxID=1114878 RepID=A0ABS5SBY7_9BACT|nr:archease [Geomobilimonas luticola]MBT0652875.1 archease [Geomobilimonas luticola]